MPTEELELPTAVAETDTPTVEVPDATAGDAPSAPVVETATTEPAAPLATRQRGPDGRFIKADGTEASEAEHAAIEAAVPAPVTPPVTTPPPIVGEPFVFRAAGQKIPIPGATLSPDGALRIPPEQVSALRQLLSEGVTHRGSWRKERETFQRQVSEAGAVQEARASKYNAASMHMLDTIESPRWQEEFRQDPERALYYLKRDLGIMLKEADLKAPRVAEVAKPEPEVQEQQLEASATAVLQDVVEEMLESPTAKAMYATPAERQALIQWFTRHLPSYAEQQNGEWVIDTEIVKADFEDQLKLRQQAKTAGAAAQKAVAFNAARNQPAAAIPPVVSTKGPGGSGQANGRVYKTKEEYAKAMGLT